MLNFLSLLWQRACFFPPCSRPEPRYQIALVWTGDSGWTVEGGLLSLRAWPSSVLCFNAPYFSSPRHLNGAVTLHPHLLGKSFWPYQAPYSVCPLIFEYSVMSSHVCMMVYWGPQKKKKCKKRKDYICLKKRKVAIMRNKRLAAPTLNPVDHKLQFLKPFSNLVFI